MQEAALRNVAERSGGGAQFPNAFHTINPRAPCSLSGLTLSAERRGSTTVNSALPLAPWILQNSSHCQTLPKHLAGNLSPPMSGGRADNDLHVEAGHADSAECIFSPEEAEKSRAKRQERIDPFFYPRFFCPSTETVAKVWAGRLAPCQRALAGALPQNRAD